VKNENINVEYTVYEKPFHWGNLEGKFIYRWLREIVKGALEREHISLWVVHPGRASLLDNMKDILRKALEPAICIHRVSTGEPTGGLLAVDSERQMTEGSWNGAFLWELC